MKINKKILLGSTAAMVALSPLAVQQLQAATATVGVNATIAAAIQLQELTSINFGVLTQTLTPTATVAIDFADTLSAGGGFNSIGGTPSSGVLKITAQTGVPFVISSGAGPFNIDDGGGNSMTISQIEYSIAANTGASVTYSFTGGATTGNVNIGATLKATASMPAGTYTGNIVVDVSYN